ncbi:hypothetical protein D3Z36_10395 [Lachnospiraceae bacterium]|nr:hypothetical protein [Lachnospiraceae bacterium]
MDLYMYEILEDYQFSETDEEREEIFSSFCRLIWENPNQRTIVNRPVTFRIRADLLATEIGRIFSAYASLPRTVCPSVTREQDFASLIRQKVNNIYTHYFDETICRNKDYIKMLMLPKKLYFQWLSAVQKNDQSWTFSPQELSRTLEDAMTQAQLIKETCARQTMSLSWEDFQVVAESYFRKLFEHYQPLDEFQNRQKITVYAGDWLEDNFCIRYFCHGLEGYFRNYQKKYYGLYNVNSRRGISYERCSCGNLFLQNKKRNRKLCDNCRKNARRQSYQCYNQKRGLAVNTDLVANS